MLDTPRPMWRTRRVAGWVLIGLTASLVELALLRLLYEVLQWPLPVATATAAEILILVKFVVTDRLVFGHPSPTAERLVRYHGASAGAFVGCILKGASLLSVWLRKPYRATRDIDVLVHPQSVVH